MKRNATEILHRGFDSMVANWPLLLIRVAENILIILVLVGGVIAAIVPLVVAAGLQRFDLLEGGDPGEMLRSLLFQHWGLILYIIIVVTLLLGVVIAIHSFVEAGSARVYVDAERAAGPARVPRNTLAFFTAERWVAGGRAGWWAVFWIYNIAWTVAGLILLVPLLAALVVILMLRESPAAIAVGCVTLAISLFLGLIIAVGTNVWTQKAIVVQTEHHIGAVAALRRSWDEAWADFSRHFQVAFVLLVIMIGGGALLGGLSAVLSAAGGSGLAPLTVPLQLVVSLINTVFAGAVAGWLLASFAALSD